MELYQLYKSPEQAANVNSVKILELEVNIRSDIGHFSVGHLLLWNTWDQICQNARVSPVNIEK